MDLLTHVSGMSAVAAEQERDITSQYHSLHFTIDRQALTSCAEQHMLTSSNSRHANIIIELPTPSACIRVCTCSVSFILFSSNSGFVHLQNLCRSSPHASSATIAPISHAMHSCTSSLKIQGKHARQADAYRLSKQRIAW